MISTVWRVKSEEFDSTEFIKRNELKPDAIFSGGFNLCLFDDSSKTNFLENLYEAINDYEDVFIELMERDIISQLDIGVTVGTDDQFTCSIVLPPEIIKKLSHLNIEVSFSAYPASD
jgi:hypothetical protein